MLNLICLTLLATAMFTNSLLQAAPHDLTAETRDSVALAIYNKELALVNEAFTMRLPAGETRLNFQSVSPLINASSAVLHPLPETLVVRNQYFQQALTADNLLEKSVGKMLSLVSTHPVTGEKNSVRARVVTVKGGLILEIDGQFETSLAGRRIVYDSLPPGVLSPTLSIDVHNALSSQSTLNLSYLSGGLSWQADYVALLDESGGRLQLQAMASIKNHSGVDFQSAAVELIAGSINQVSNKVNARRDMASTAMMADEVSIQPTPLADVYVYSLPQPVDLSNNSARQVKLFEARDVPVTRQYRFDGSPNVYHAPNIPEKMGEVDSYVKFMNVADSDLGKPMPAGVVRVYAQDDSLVDKLRFVGEDRIGHLPAGAQVRLKMGKAFDLKGTRKQLSYRRLPIKEPYRQHNEVRIQIVLTSAKKEPVVVQVTELFSGEWALIDGPKPFLSDAHSAQWDVHVPAQGETTLDLTIRIKR